MMLFLLPALLASETFVEKVENFRDVELHVLEVEVLLVVLLHFE